MTDNSAKILSVNCNHCGATLEVADGVRYVTCSYCQSRLMIERTGSAVFTEVLDKIEKQTGKIAENLKVIELQNDLSALDRDWQNCRESLLVSGKNGVKSEPSTMGGMAGVLIGGVGGFIWIMFAMSMHAPAFFPLFGVLFIAVGVISGLNSMNKGQKLEDSRKNYEARRRDLLAAIETEKQRQL